MHCMIAASREMSDEPDKLEYLQIGQLAVAPFITAQTAVVKTEGDKKGGKHIHDGTFSFFTEKILEF